VGPAAGIGSAIPEAHAIFVDITVWFTGIILVAISSITPHNPNDPPFALYQTKPISSSHEQAFA
jgi:hypothetical protein